MFHRPYSFFAGSLLITVGVLSHAPMLMMGRYTDGQMVGMPMTPGMLVGMVMIGIGLVLAWRALVPGAATGLAGRSGEAFHFHVADNVALNAEHWKLVLVLTVTLAIDVMKPATLGFVIPGMSREYGLARPQASLLALFALTGTTVGSVVWGRMADRMGRRAAILLSALMFIGTSICAAMPSFEWNLAMCFLMGASAGGLLPITFTLMAETVPAHHRGWLLVALGGVGTSAGYLLASGAAALLEPLFSWRILWVLGLPTGMTIIALQRYIPESPRFLWSSGRPEAALAMLRRFAGNTGVEPDDRQHPAPPVVDETHPVASARQLLQGRHARISAALLACGLCWGLVNFGFLLWLPTNLARLGVDPAASSALLAKSAIYSLPGIALVIWLYHRWSSIRALVLFTALSAASLLAFAALESLQLRSTAATTLATVALLTSVSAVIAMLVPYAAEIYPVHLRGTGSGVVAASSKFGGILGAGLGLLGFFNQFTFSACALAVPLAGTAVLLWASGIETRGLRLEEIQQKLQS